MHIVYLCIVVSCMMVIQQLMIIEVILLTRKGRREAWDKLLPSLVHITLEMLALDAMLKCIVCKR